MTWQILFGGPLATVRVAGLDRAHSFGYVEPYSQLAGLCVFNMYCMRGQKGMK